MSVRQTTVRGQALDLTIPQLSYSQRLVICTAPTNGEARQNGGNRRFDIMYGQAVLNGQTVFADITRKAVAAHTV